MTEGGGGHAMEVELDATAAAAGVGRDEAGAADEGATPMEQEEPAAAPQAGKLTKNQKRQRLRKLKRRQAAAKRAEVEAAVGRGGKRRSHGMIQKRRAKAETEREDGAQDDNMTATAKRLKQ